MDDVLKTLDILIRVSKMGERDEADDSTMTTDDQDNSCRRAIRESGGRVGIVIKALDQSGHTVVDSPGWRLALQRVQRGESHGFAVAYDDRLARNWRKVGRFYDELEEAGAEVLIAGMPGVDYRTTTGRTQTGLMAVVNDMVFLKAKERGDRIAALTLGRGVPNRVPYGYKRNGTFNGTTLVGKVDPERDAKALVPHDDHRRWVQLIFDRRGDRHSWTAIADELAAARVPSPSGSPRWSVTTLSDIIANRVYLGEVRLGKRPPILDAHLPLVTQGQFDAAQSQHSISRTGLYTGGLAVGVVTCEACGGSMSTLLAGDRKGGRRAMYGCRRQSGKGKCPHPTNVKRDAVDQALEAWVIEGIRSGAFDVLTSQRELSEARATVARAVAVRKQIVTTAADWDPEDATAAYAAAKKREGAAVAEYDRLLSEATEIDALPETVDAWHDLSLAAQRRVVQVLVARIIVTPPVSRSKFANISDRLTIVPRNGG